MSFGRLDALAALAGAGLLAGCGSEARSIPVPKPTPITASGRLDALSEARRLVAERDAVIHTIRVAAGDAVTAGQPLVELACDDVRASIEAAVGRERAAGAALALCEAGPRGEEVRAADAAVEAERARLADAEDSLARTHASFERGVVSDRALAQIQREVEARRWELERARATAAVVREGARPEERAAARANLEVARAAVSEARAQLGKCTVAAPIGGTVLRLLRREGEASGASAGETILVIADTSRMIARAEIDERDAARVRAGMKAEAWIEGSPVRYAGRVTEVAALTGRRTVRSLDPADRFDRETVEALVELSDPDAPRVVGLRVLVEIPAEAADAVDR